MRPMLVCQAMNEEKPRPTSQFAPLDAWDERARAKPPVTRSDIVQQSLAVLDAEGFDRLTMRRIAERLGVQAASLYNHVRNKGELLALLADAISGDLPAIDPRIPWRDQLA